PPWYESDMGAGTGGALAGPLTVAAHIQAAGRDRGAVPGGHRGRVAVVQPPLPRPPLLGGRVVADGAVESAPDVAGVAARDVRALAVEGAGADDRPRPREDQVVAEAPRPVLAVMQPRVGAGELERVIVVAVRRAGRMVDGHLRDLAERPIGAAPHEGAGDDDPWRGL